MNNVENPYVNLTDVSEEARIVVLVPRHFLSDNPVLPLEMVRELADRREPGVFHERFELGDREIPCLVLNIPELLERHHRDPIKLENLIPELLCCLSPVNPTAASIPGHPERPPGIVSRFQMSP